VAPDPETEAFELALRALASKERTVAELRAWLERRGCEPEAIAAAVGRLVEVDQLDDARFARRFADDKRELRGWGSERIEEALAARGVEAAEIAAALAADDEPAQVERASALLAARGAALADEAGRGRALAFLARRGYGSEVAYEAVRRAEREARKLRSGQSTSTMGVRPGGRQRHE
jgi:regulatory protein